MEIPLLSVEICICNTSTKRSLIWAPFDKISKGGDGGGSGDVGVNFVRCRKDGADVPGLNTVFGWNRKYVVHS